MDYSKIKLGLIGRFRVWNARRIAESSRAKYDKMEGEVTEVDYSEADKLEEKLLSEKKERIATRHAKRSWKKYNDGLGEAEYIENYLVENGLKPKALLPHQQENNKNNNNKDIFGYSVVKSEEEKLMDMFNEGISYTINDKEYTLPRAFVQYAKMMREEGKPLPIQQNANGKYVLNDDTMEPVDKYQMLKSATNISAAFVGEMMLGSDKSDKELNEKYLSLFHGGVNPRDYLSKKAFQEGNVDKANEILNKSLGDILEFNNYMKEKNEPVKEDAGQVIE